MLDDTIKMTGYCQATIRKYFRRLLEEGFAKEEKIIGDSENYTVHIRSTWDVDNMPSCWCPYPVVDNHKQS